MKHNCTILRFHRCNRCLPRKGSSIGQLLFQDGPIQPGKAVGKDLPPVGDVSIKGIVNIAGFMEHAVLQSTRLHLPFEMSRITCTRLTTCL